MIKKWFIVILVSCTLIFGFSANHIVLGVDNHYSLPYKIFFINDYCTAIWFLTAQIDMDTKNIRLEYRPITAYGINSINVNVGVIDYKNNSITLKKLKSVEVKIVEISHKELLTTNIKIPKLEEGMEIVIWPSDPKPRYDDFPLFSMEEIIQRVQAISWEQFRLANILIEEGEEELIQEITRNLEE